MNVDALPLLPECVDDPVVAWREGCPVSRHTFLTEVHALAAQLPEAHYAINLCRDRYRFAVALFAAIVRGVHSVLPNVSAPDYLAVVCADLSAPVILLDYELDLERLPGVRMVRVDAPVSGAIATERVSWTTVAFDRPVASVYTSGSTGRPQSHIKSFGRLCQGAVAEAARIREQTGVDCNVLGTVPIQHMYGLESTVLMPLLGGGRLTSRQPFFPADIAAALYELPEPRLLVSTPYHLRKLVESGLTLPPVAGVLSATAPLERDLAVRIEQVLDAPLLEIYGSTETGQMASRRSALQDTWRLFPGVVLRQYAGATVASGGHLEEERMLGDHVEFVAPEEFRLLGRHSDMINIAGKRNSLQFLNHVLMQIPGVEDGVFCLPQMGTADGVSRLAAFVVAPGLDAITLQAALLTQIDPVFLPRPLVFVEALPRDRNGKLTAASLAGLLAQHAACGA